MIMVDEDNTCNGEFGYKNKEGDIEYVAVHANDSVLFYDHWDEDMSCIFIDDIPKMIKALQADYDYSKK